MNDIMINTERKYSATVIPNIFIDRYLASANGAYVKVYLYLLRCLTGTEMQFSISTAADFFDAPENDIIRALKYWDKNNVIRLACRGAEITGITLLDLASEHQTASRQNKSNVISLNDIRAEISRTDVPEQLEESAPEKKTATPAVPSLSRKDITAALSSPEIEWLTKAVEMYLERPLTSEDQNLIIYLFNNLKFSKDLILHLYEVCISRDKKKNSYIQAVAIDWYDNGVKTTDDADRHSLSYNPYYIAVNKAFNLGRLPGDKEQKFINSWESMGFSPEMVKEACDRTLLKCNKPNFPYADKILTAWESEGIKDPETLKEKDDAFKAAKDAGRSGAAKSVSRSAKKYLDRYPQRETSYSDMAEIERMLVADTFKRNNPSDGEN
jgi:DnaD/phage-associated family protein